MFAAVQARCRQIVVNLDVGQINEAGAVGLGEQDLKRISRLSKFLGVPPKRPVSEFFIPPP